MAYSVPTSLPSSFTAGTTWRWDETVSDYPPSEGWLLSRRFVGDSASLELAASVVGTTYQFTATATQTAALPAGTYRVFAWVTSGAIKYPVDDATITVQPDPAALAPGSQLTRDEAMLVTVRAAIDALLEGKVASYSIGDRSFTLLNLPELTSMESRLIERVRRARGQMFGQYMAAHFVATS